MMTSAPVVWLRRLGLPVLGLALLTTGTLIDRHVREEEGARIAAYVEAAERHVDAYCSVQDAIASDPFFLRPRSRATAGDALNIDLPWAGRDSDTPPPLALPPEVRAQLRTWGERWLTDGRAAAAPPLDFTWMAALQAHEAWRVTGPGPLGGKRRVDPFSMPIPAFGALVDWSKLRFLAALHAGEPERAAAEVRHLAHLAWTTGLPAGTHAATRLLRLEHDVWQQLQSAGEAPRWEPATEAFLTRLEQVSRGHAMFRMSVLPRPTVDRLLSCGSPATRCALALENVVWTGLARALNGGDDGRYGAVRRAVAGDPDCDSNLAELTGAWYGEPGALPGDARAALAERTGALGRMTTFIEIRGVDELLAMMLVARTLPRADTLASNFEASAAAEAVTRSR